MSKRYNEIVKQVTMGKTLPPAEAFAQVKKTANAKFVESVDLAVKLNYIPKKSETLRSTVNLPHGSGKKIKVGVVASAGKVDEAQKAGADVAGSDDLIEKIQGGFMDFDILLATPDMMPKLAKLGKILGTKGLMPNPKAGTVSADIGKTVKEFKTGKLEFRVDKGGVVHLILGKVNFEVPQLEENLKIVLEAVRKLKPGSVKGAFIRSVSISATMGPSVRIDTRSILEHA